MAVLSFSRSMLTWQGIVMSDQGLFTLLVGGLVGLFQVLPTLLGNVSLLESFSKVGHRHILVLSLAFEVLLHTTSHLQQRVAKRLVRKGH